MSAQAPTERLKATLFPSNSFAALGRLEAVNHAMGLMADYGSQVWAILQDISLHPRSLWCACLAVRGQCRVQQVFEVNDFETAKWLSKSMG